MPSVEVDRTPCLTLCGRSCPSHVLLLSCASYPCSTTTTTTTTYYYLLLLLLLLLLLPTTTTILLLYYFLSLLDKVDEDGNGTLDLNEFMQASSLLAVVAK